MLVRSHFKSLEEQHYAIILYPLQLAREQNRKLAMSASRSLVSMLCGCIGPIECAHYDFICVSLCKEADVTQLS